MSYVPGLRPKGANNGGSISEGILHTFSQGIEFFFLACTSKV